MAKYRRNLPVFYLNNVIYVKFYLPKKVIFPDRTGKISHNITGNVRELIQQTPADLTILNNYTESLYTQNQKKTLPCGLAMSSRYVRYGQDTTTTAKQAFCCPRRLHQRQISAFLRHMFATCTMRRIDTSFPAIFAVKLYYFQNSWPELAKGHLFPPKTA